MTKDEFWDRVEHGDYRTVYLHNPHIIEPNRVYSGYIIDFRGASGGMVIGDRTFGLMSSPEDSPYRAISYEMVEAVI